MNERPDDLPGVVRHSRPLPEDGLARVVRAGRRRRALVAAGSGAAALTVAAVVAAVTLQPGGSQSLRYADDTPTPTASATATESATSDPSATASPQPGESGPAASPAASEEATPPAETASPGPDHETYSEAPREEAAPLDCRQPPSGQAGPVIYGGGTACAVSRSSSSTEVKRGGSVYDDVDMCNAYGTGDLTLGYDSGREHEVTVYDSDGNLVYRFSQAVTYAQGAHQRTLHDGTCLIWRGTWDTTTQNGELAPAGVYRVRIVVRADSVNGRRTAPEEGGETEFSVSVS